MTIQSDNRKAFNDALRTVSKSNREILSIYTNALKKAKEEIAIFKIKVEKGLLSPVQALQQKRIEKLIVTLNDQIAAIYFAQGDIIASGFTKNYVDAYYQIGFAIEKDVNLVTLPEQGSKYSYSLNYSRVNPAYAGGQLNSIIAGMTFKERQGIDKLIMQAKVRSIINNAIIEGLTPKQVAKELSNLSIVYEQNANKAITTARTELLRAYSEANEYAIQISQDRGVEGQKIWDATLDGRTRPQHAKMDLKEADENGLFRMPNGEQTLGPRLPGLSAANSINCRCKSVYQPTGVVANVRGFRSADGDWKMTRGDMDYQEWSKTLEGQASIEKTKIDRRKMAKRAADKKKQAKG